MEAKGKISPILSALRDTLKGGGIYNGGQLELVSVDWGELRRRIS